MKERILTNWTFTRVLYVVIGMYVVIQSAMTHQWAGVIFGGYFASMGLFAFGCAGGNCAVRTKQNTSENIQGIAFEEVKTK